MGPLSISLDYLKKVSARIISYLDLENIHNLNDLGRISGHRLLVSMGEYISVRAPRTEPSKIRYSLSYVSFAKGSPLEIRITSAEGINLDIKVNLKLPGYDVYFKDNLGNYHQTKKIKSQSIKVLREELKGLAGSNGNGRVEKKYQNGRYK